MLKMCICRYVEDVHMQNAMYWQHQVHSWDSVACRSCGRQCHVHVVMRPLGDVPGVAWLRIVGSLKSQVSCAKEPYKRDYILQKRRIILRNLLIVATPQWYEEVVRYVAVLPTHHTCTLPCYSSIACRSGRRQWHARVVLRRLRDVAGCCLQKLCHMWLCYASIAHVCFRATLASHIYGTWHLEQIERASSKAAILFYME